MNGATFEVTRVSGCSWRVTGPRVRVGDRLEQFGGPDGARRVWNVYEVDCEPLTTGHRQAWVRVVEVGGTYAGNAFGMHFSHD